MPHPGLLPTVISLNAVGSCAKMAYRSGFRNPSGGRWLEMRAELSRETKPATVGDEAEVPPMRNEPFPMITLNRSASAEISGMAWVRVGGEHEYS